MRPLQILVLTPFILAVGVIAGIVCLFLLAGYLALFRYLGDGITRLGVAIQRTYSNGIDRVRQTITSYKLRKWNERLEAKRKAAATKAGISLSSAFDTADDSYLRIYHPLFAVHAILCAIQPNGKMKIKLWGETYENVPCAGWVVYRTTEPVSEWMRSVIPYPGRYVAVYQNPVSHQNSISFRDYHWKANS